MPETGWIDGDMIILRPFETDTVIYIIKYKYSCICIKSTMVKLQTDTLDTQVDNDLLKQIYLVRSLDVSQLRGQ